LPSPLSRTSEYTVTVHSLSLAQILQYLSREKSIAYFNQKVTEDEEIRQRIKAVQIPLGNWRFNL
jgi:hypothetical protein